MTCCIEFESYTTYGYPNLKSVNHEGTDLQERLWKSWMISRWYWQTIKSASRVRGSMKLSAALRILFTWSWQLGLISKFPETGEVCAKQENITCTDRERYYLYMRNNGSRYLNPSKGPRENTVTNLKYETQKRRKERYLAWIQHLFEQIQAPIHLKLNGIKITKKLCRTTCKTIG